ncbi:MAG: methylamine utilization protein MauF [Geminicoccaceae bacterium]|nr:methylamine utilization protein MauF [Geminicoccaceae bacterium]
MLVGLAFLGGLLSTWSPCGYSSLATLRPWGRWSIRGVAGWLPTLSAHGAGYVAGGLVLGSASALGALVLAPPADASWPLLAIALVSLAYGLDQLGFLSLPYPQRKSQVPHDVRFRWPMWRIGLLYGFALGLNFVTYVRTPILYVVVVAALLSGSWATAFALVLALNAGRFLPLLVNALPVTDRAVQAWLARHEEHAVLAGGAAQLAAAAAIVAALANL